MKLLLLLTSALLIGIVLQSCSKDEGPFLPLGSGLSEADTVSYATYIQPIFDANCTKCHNETHAKLDLKAAVSYNELLTYGFNAPYVNTVNAEQSNIYLHLTGALSIMPPAGALPESDQNLILYWIKQGALDN